jgi:transposase
VENVNMKRFQFPDRRQNLLLAHVNLDSVAPVGSAVRTIDELVNKLDTRELEKGYAMEVQTGQRPIHPKTILKIALFAMHNCRFSLRKMEEDLEFNLMYRWLSGDIRIDHSTLGRFLVKNKEFISPLFTQVVMIAVEHDLVDFEVLGIDSLKIRANASYKKDRTLVEIEKEEGKLKIKIEEMLTEIEKSGERDMKQVKILEKRKIRLTQAGAELEERIKEKSEGKSEVQAEKIKKTEKINVTDFDAHKMQQRNGEINPAYSTTIATDTKADIITNFQVNLQDNDEVALLPVVEGSLDRTGKKHDVIVADSGFSSLNNLEKLEERKQFSLIPDKRYEVDKNEDQKKGKFDRSNFIYNQEKDNYKCPANRVLNKTTVFRQNEREIFRYENPPACAGCKFLPECSRGNHRTISRDSNEQIKVEMRENLNFLGNQEIYKMRAHSAESPTGQMKHNLKFRIFMRRGKEKIKMEMGLLCMLHNILKIGKILNPRQGCPI